MNTAEVKKVDVLKTDGGLRMVAQFLVKIGRTTISTHDDEASATAAMNEANTARQRFRNRIKNG